MTLRRLLIACLFVAAPGMVLAATPDKPGPVPMTDVELDSYRGGYEVTPDLSFQFGAVVKTFEDGQLALQTQVNLTQNSFSVQQTPGTGVSPGTASNIDLAGMTGTAFSTPNGTTFVQNVTNGQLANFIFNTDSNRTFRQETNVTLVLPGFADIQNQMVRNLSGLRLGNDLANQTIHALSH